MVEPGWRPSWLTYFAFKIKTNKNMFYFECVRVNSMTIIDKFYIKRKLIFSSFT